MLALQPEYEFFTYVEVKLYLGGDNTKTNPIVLSKLGEYFQSLTITEGSPQEGGTQVVTADQGGGVVSGTLTI